MDDNGSNGMYKIQAGDTLENIAAKNGVSVDALKSANLDVSNNDLLYPGKTINIPAINHSGLAVESGANPNFSTFQSVGYDDTKNVVVGGGDAAVEQSKSPEESVSQSLSLPKPAKNSFFSKFKLF